MAKKGDNHHKYREKHRRYKGVEWSVFDGDFPDCAPYVSVFIPDSWFTDEAYARMERPGATGAGLFCVDLADLVNRNCYYEDDGPNKEAARLTVQALRRYADWLEGKWVNGPRAYSQADGEREMERILQELDKR